MGRKRRREKQKKAWMEQIALEGHGKKKQMRKICLFIFFDTSIKFYGNKKRNDIWI